MRFDFNQLTLILVLCLLVSCTRKEDKKMHQRLVNLDHLINNHPKAVSDSLKTISYNHISRSNRAYYGLLKIISDDKTYVNFTTDSIINRVANYYRTHDPGNENYIRALAYQAIVRTRMGITDSTVFEPLKEADKYFQKQPNKKPSLGYLIHYFLGNIHYNNGNNQLTDVYFKNALNFAKQENDSTHLLDSYTALFWNKLTVGDVQKGKLYLDSLSHFYGKVACKDGFILNAQSAYYDVVGEKEKALECDKKQLSMANLFKEQIDVSKLYYNISNKYKNAGQLDSAMLYGQVAIDRISDSTYRHNYLYYQNVANIALEQNNYPLANEYLTKSFDVYNRSISDRLNTQLMELEKKYDLTEAENEILRARQNTLITLLGALTSIILLSVLYIITRRKRRKERTRLMLAEYKMQQQEAQAALMKEEANKRKWLLQLYGHISDRLTFLYGEMASLSQRFITSQPKVYKELQNLLKNTDANLRDITKSLAPDDETFYSYTHLKEEANIFTTPEKMLLMLLACNADNRQLATFMNTSVDSIRVRKSHLKKKMTEKGIETEGFFDS